MTDTKTKMLPPRSSPVLPPGASPVFRAKFSDGTKVRMSVYTLLNPLDIKRAVAVSRAAYSSRLHIPMSAITATIVEAHFEKDGKILQRYGTEELGKVSA